MDQKNQHSTFYIGHQTLLKDFKDIKECWKSTKTDLRQKDFKKLKADCVKCSIKLENLALVIEKMVFMKQNKIIDLFYVSLLFAMALIVLIIYLVRKFIEYKIKQHAIYDLETKLFNKKYFVSSLATFCAKSLRHKESLSVLWITLIDPNDVMLDKKRRNIMLSLFGEIIQSEVRTSDIACKYEEDKFSILLPVTKKENVLVLEKRLHQAFEGNKLLREEDLKVTFKTIQFNHEETPEVFISRSETLLND